MITSKYFSEREFQKCTPSCSLQDMKQEAMDKFDKAREIAGIPFVITCAYRSKEWDVSRGRSGEGAHPHGYALDIKCNSSVNRMKIIKALVAVNCRRFAIGRGFVHADFDPNLSQDIMWEY